MPETDQQSVKLHPQVANFLALLVASKPPGWHEMTPAEGRATFAKLDGFFGKRVELESVIEAKLPNGTPIRIYSDNKAGSGKLECCVVYFHGGGWVLGNLDTHDALCRLITKTAGCKLISVDYGLSPENRFPTALEQCYAATKFISDNHQQFGIDPVRLAVAGDSAGGNLAAAVAMLCRDRGTPELGLQVLVYPVVEPNFENASYTSFAQGFGLTRASMQWFWAQYLTSELQNVRSLNPLAVLSQAVLKDLPPAYVLTAEFDVLRDEGEAYASRLEKAGVHVQLRRYDGMIHGFVHMSSVFDVAHEAINEICAVIRSKLS